LPRAGDAPGSYLIRLNSICRGIAWYAWRWSRQPRPVRMPTRCARRVGTRLGAGFTLTQLGQRLDGALMKDLESLDAAFVIDTFLLLLIGIGPKIALVPFLDMTVDMPEATKRRIVRKMLTTAATVAALLLVLGGLLTRLLHFSPGALGVASGIILLVIAVAMVLGHQSGSGGDHPVEGRDPMQVAVFPLAVPYLLNPAGIVVLVTLSAEASSIAVLGVGVGVLAVVLAFDVVVFRWAVQVSSKLDASRMLVTEKVFGFLLAALGVQLVLNGLSDVGVIHLTTGH
jgi:small neutral amino acid transporter SnatA (MarC family)